MGAMKSVYLTRSKYEELSAKLNELRTVEFPRNREVMRAAIESGGGMHDNASYEHAAEHERLLAAQISDLEKTLASAQIIDESTVDVSAVRVGTEVIAVNLDTGKEARYTITGAYETDFSGDCVSYLSPIGEGLLGRRVGDVVVVPIPKGGLRLKIVTIGRAADL